MKHRRPWVLSSKTYSLQEVEKQISTNSQTSSLLFKLGDMSNKPIVRMHRRSYKSKSEQKPF